MHQLVERRDLGPDLFGDRRRRPDINKFTKPARSSGHQQIYDVAGMVYEHASRQRVGFDAFDLRKLIKPILDLLKELPMVPPVVNPKSNAARNAVNDMRRCL